METLRNRFTVTPTLVALFAALVSLPSIAIVKVNAFGLGVEHEQPWRRAANGLADALAAITLVLGWMRSWFRRKPTWARAGMLATAVFLLMLVDRSAPAAMAMAITEGQHAGEFILEERAFGSSRENITVLSGQDLSAGAVVGRVTKGIGRVSIPTVVGTGDGTASAVFAGPEVEVGNYVVTCTAVATHGGTFSVTTPSGKVLPSLVLTASTGATTVYTSRHINFSITDGSADFIVGDAFTFVVSTTAPTVIGGTGTGVMTALSLGPDAKPGNYRVINRVVIANGGDFEVISPDGDSVGRFNWTNSGSTASFTSRQVNFTLSDSTDYIAGNYFDICVFNQLGGGKVVAWDPTTFDGRDDAIGVLYDNVDAGSGDLAGVILTRDAAVLKSALQWGAAITAAQKESAYKDLAVRGIVAR